jgi:hypothetical protein
MGRKGTLKTKAASIPHEFNLFLISSWMQFSLVTAVPKYLNVATFSKDLLVILHFGEETQLYT